MEVYLFRLLSMTQEHGRVEPLSGRLDYSKYPLGSLLSLIPYHVGAISQCRVRFNKRLN